MPDQPKHRHPAEPAPQLGSFEDDIRGVLVAIEQDPYDEDRLMIEAFERWAADDSITFEQFLDGARRVLRASVKARETYEGSLR
jgi:hypothetical protein